jgi:hypothetical protein
MARRRWGAGGDAGLAEDLARTMLDRLDEPRLELFLGRLGGRPVALAGVVNLGDVGVLVPACTESDPPADDVAPTILAHTLEHCARAGFRQVVLERHEDCPTIPFYAAMGFAESARHVRYVRAHV